MLCDYKCAVSINVSCNSMSAGVRRYPGRVCVLTRVFVRNACVLACMCACMVCRLQAPQEHMRFCIHFIRDKFAHFMFMHSQVKFLRSAIKGVVSAGSALCASARTRPTDPSEAAGRAAVGTVANHQAALVLSVKSVVQACEMLTSKGQHVCV